jgi:fructuronate reductase
MHWPMGLRNRPTVSSGPMKRLQPSNLDDLASTVKLPQYDRSSIRPGILHFGLGAFHRAHQAVFTDTAMANSGGDWGIIGVSLRSDTVFKQLDPQGCLYSVMAEDAAGHELRLVGAIQQVIVAPSEPLQVIEQVANPDIKIITLTITEKGYCLAADGKSLDTAAAGIVRDLQNPQEPLSVIGLLARGLERRFQGGGHALSIISCDNLAENSERLRGVLMDYLQTCFPDVIPWVEASVTFPCSMVDRIVPAMDEDRVSRQASSLGLRDEAAIITEPFSQWIIEDKFAADRPRWESAGVQFVDDICPFEAIKLGLLNATHSAIAYAGLLAGHSTVDEVMADRKLRDFVQKLMLEDLMPSLEVPPNFDLHAYQQQLLQRFDNPCLQHLCRQIAMDGSEKIPQRWLPALNASIIGGEPPRTLVKALALWCYFILCSDQDIEDPRAERLYAVRDSPSDLQWRERIEALLDCARINSQALESFNQLCNTLEADLELLKQEGVYALAPG